MSEPTEIPTATAKPDSDAEEGEVVEATAVETTDTDNAVEAKAVAEDDNIKEDGEISPSKDPLKAPDQKRADDHQEEKTKTEGTKEEPSPSVDVKAEDPAAATEKATTTTTTEETATKDASMKFEDTAADATAKEEESAKEAPTEADASEEKEPEEIAEKDTTTKIEAPEPVPPATANTEEKAEAENKERKMEEGELEEVQVDDKPKEHPEKKEEPVKAEAEKDGSTETPAAETSKTEEPTPMDVDESKLAKMEEASAEEEGEVMEDTEEDGEVKEDAEEGEVKEETEEEGEAKEDETMEESKTETDERAAHDETPDTYADTASTDGDTASMIDEKPSYSTRGRGASGTATPVLRDNQATSKSSTKDTASVAGSQSDQWERSVREALEGLSRTAKDGAPAGVGTGGSSFLEALGEEERRTRTRFLPAVDGIHQLKKNEIKNDLAFARSIMSQGGNVTSVASVAGTSGPSISKKSSKSKKKQQDGEPESMEVDEGGRSPTPDNDMASDVRFGNASTIEVTSEDVLNVPSAAFVPPPAATMSARTSSANGDKKDEGGHPAPMVSTGVKEILNNQGNIKAPRVVESVSAFDPPRPPESVGKKKQHRMLRWERRPADVEVDLSNYRKTVDRTRKELHTAQSELERIEDTSNHLRRHFLGHLRCMDQETDVILEELNAVQQQCVSAADLLTSRTRSRGAGKASYVMKDVINELKAKGAELTEKGLALQPEFIAEAAQNFPGIGGVSAVSFADWDQHTLVTPQRIASAWVLPGDKVQTPCGEGKVLKVFKSSSLDVTDPPVSETLEKSQASSGGSPTKMDVDQPPKAKASSGEKKKGAGKIDGKSYTQSFVSMLAPRICVRVPFGVGYFSPKDVTSKACANTLSDSHLVMRWKSILETANMVAGQLDQAGMATIGAVSRSPEDADELNSEEPGSIAAGGDAAMDVDGVTKEKSGAFAGQGETAKKNVGTSKLKLLPFGSGLLPTGSGRGNHLAEMDSQELQKAIQPALLEGKGVLGDVSFGF